MLYIVVFTAFNAVQARAATQNKAATLAPCHPGFVAAKAGAGGQGGVAGAAGGGGGLAGWVLPVGGASGGSLGTGAFAGGGRLPVEGRVMVLPSTAAKPASQHQQHSDATRPVQVLVKGHQNLRPDRGSALGNRSFSRTGPRQCEITV